MPDFAKHREDRHARLRAVGVDPAELTFMPPNVLASPPAGDVTEDLRVEAASLAAELIAEGDRREAKASERGPSRTFSPHAHWLLAECLEEAILTMTMLAHQVPDSHAESFAREAFEPRTLIRFAARALVLMRWEPGVRIKTEIKAVDGVPVAGVVDDGKGRPS